jgi:hypothetical protein
MAANLGELRAFTHDHADGIITDEVFHKHVGLMALKSTQRTYPGGTYVRTGLEISKDEQGQTGGAIEARGGFNMTEIEGHDAAQYRPRYYVQTIPLWDSDVADNGSSATQYWNFVARRIALYMKFMRERFSRHMYSKGGGTLQINGFGDIYDNNSTFGMIDRTKYDWWRTFNYRSTTPQAITTLLLANMLSAVSDGDIEPDLLLTSTQIYDKIESLLDPKERFENTMLANAGFRNITYRGIPIVKDKNCDTDGPQRHKIYALNFDHIFWTSHVMFNMKKRDWNFMPKNLGQYMIVIWFGNVMPNSLRRQGLIADINPAA